MTERRTVDLDAVRIARLNLRRLAIEHPELTGARGKTNRQGWETMLENTMGETKDEQIAVRLEASLVERLDKYAERLRREMPGPSWKRSDVVRLLLARALDEAEPAKPTRGKR